MVDVDDAGVAGNLDVAGIGLSSAAAGHHADDTFVSRNLAIHANAVAVSGIEY